MDYAHVVLAHNCNVVLYDNTTKVYVKYNVGRPGVEKMCDFQESNQYFKFLQAW